jgi:hypothetical protein
MKVFVRSLVIALAVTGAFATSFAAKATAPVKTSAMPVPTCQPGYSDCGIGGW